jgi:DNA repair protein RadC
VYGTEAGNEMTTLYVREGNEFREAPAHEVLLQAKELIDEQFHSRFLVLGNPEQVRLFLKIQLGGRGHEVFAALFLDARRRLIEYVELFRGTIDLAAVYPREVVKEALARNAAGVILVHNHPSGVAEPTAADEQITRRLKAALDLVGVEVIDHMVVGESITSSWGLFDSALHRA